MRVRQVGVPAIGRGRSIGTLVQPRRLGDRVAQLLKILFVAQLRILVEPLRRQDLGGDSPAFAAVGQAQRDAQKELRRLAQGDDAESKRHAQGDVALGRFDADDRQFRWVHGVASSNPRR